MELFTINHKPITRVKRGFTLVELLVVITIIAIMAALVLLVINPAEMARKARDSTRFRDLENARKAIDLQVAQGEVVPTGGPYNSRDHGRACGSTSGWVRGIDLCEYLPVLPIDPVNDSTFQYQFQGDGSDYEIRVKVESEGNFASAENDGGSDNTCTEGVAGGGSNCWLETGTNMSIIP